MDIVFNEPNRTNRSIDASKCFLDESFQTSTDIWDSLLTHQAALFAPAEICYLAANPAWAEARTVADIGCGNGEYLHLLQKAFPRKTYNGIDNAPLLIERARRRHDMFGSRFHLGDIIEQGPEIKSDAIILRFMVQHLPNPRLFFNSLRKYAHSTTLALVIEPNFAASKVLPDLHLFSDLVTRYEDRCRAMGNARSVTDGNTPFSAICGHSWQVTGIERLASRHERSSWNALDLERVFVGWIDALEVSGAVSYDFPAVRCELADWLSATGESAEIVLNIVSLKPAV